jgi:hypothetical protein
MRTKFLIICLLFSEICFCQAYPPGDSLNLMAFDTLRVEMIGEVKGYDLQSTTQFPFCSQIFKIIDDCDDPQISNCCRFATNVYEPQKTINVGSVNCMYSGRTLSWMYTNDTLDAKQMMESYISQVTEQSLSLKKRSVKCFIMNQESQAYLCEIESKSNLKYSVLYYYGSYKQYHFMLSYSHIGTLNSNEAIQPSFKEIFRF